MRQTARTLLVPSLIAVFPTGADERRHELQVREMNS